MQIAGELSVRDAAAADAVNNEDAATSPLVDLVIVGTLDDEALARALTNSSARPRVRWDMLENYGLERAYHAYRSICSRFQCIPLRLAADSHVEVAMVDPTWKAAHEALNDHFGVPVRPFVFSHTDYLYLVHPELRPTRDDMLEFGHTVEELVSVELVELLKHLRDGDSLVPDMPPEAQTHRLEHDEYVSTAELETDARAYAEEHGLDPETGEFPRSENRTPYSTPRVLVESDAFESEEYSIVPALEAIHQLMDQAVEASLGDHVWRDFFDILSMVSVVCLRGVHVGTDLYFADCWVDGSEVSKREWGLFGQMLHRVYPSFDSSLHVLQLEPRQRDEIDLVAYAGTNVLLTTYQSGDHECSFLALIGMQGEWIRALGGVMARMLRHDRFLSLLQLQGVPGATLIRVA